MKVGQAKACPTNLTGRVVADSERSFTDSRPRQMIRSSAADEPVVYGVGPYPEPHHGVFMFHSKRPVMQADPNGPKASQPLEVQRRVLRVSSQELVGFVSQAADIVGKLSITSQNFGLAWCLTDPCNGQPADLRSLRPPARSGVPLRHHLPFGGPRPRRRIRQTMS